MHTGGGFFRHTFNGVADRRIETWLLYQIALHHGVERFFFFVLWVVQNAGVFFSFWAQDAQQGCIATVVQDQIWIATIGPFKDFVDIFPILQKRFAFDGEYRHASRGNGCRSLVLGRIDIARRPTDISAQSGQGFNQYTGLDRHVQAASDAGAFQNLGGAIFSTRCHQAGHFGFSNSQFLAAPVSQADVGHDIVSHEESSKSRCLRQRPSRTGP